MLALGLLAPIVIIAVLLVGNARVHKANRQTRENLYAADMSLADRALREGNLGLARATLASHLPAPGTEDLRGFEWRLLWQQSQGDQLRTLSGFPHPPSALAISPDGQTLAIAGQHFLWRWELKATNGVELLPTKDSRWLEPEDAAKLIAKVRTGPYLRHQVSNTNPPVRDYSAMVNPTRIDRVTRLSYSADGRSVLSSTRETWRAARVWNIADGTLDFAFPAVWSDAAMSPVSPIAAVGSYAAHGETGCVKLYDLERREEIWALPETGGLIAFSGDGQFLATSGIDAATTNGAVWIWSLAEHRLRQHISLSNIWETLAVSPDGRWVAGAGINLPTIEIWSVEEPRQAATLSGHAGAIRDLAFSPDGRTLASAGADQIVRLWSVPNGKLIAQLTGHADEINSLAYFKDGQTLATASRDGTVRLWSTRVNTPEPQTFNGGGFLGRLEVSPDSRRWTSTSQTWQSVRIGDTQTGTGQLIPPPRLPEAQNEGFDDAGQTVVTSFCPEGRAVLKLEWHSVADLSLVRSVVLEGGASVLPIRSFCAAAGLFAQGADGGIVRVWSTRTGKLLLTLGLPDHIDKHPRINNTVNHVLISPDGTRLAAGGLGNSQISVFALPDGKLLHSGHVRPLFMVGDNPVDPGNLNSITFSPDSKMLVSTDLTEPGLRLWEASTGRALGELSGHRDHTVDAAFSPDGRTLASTGADGSLKLWHLPTLREVATLLEGQAVGPVAFTSDGTQLLVGLSTEVKIFRATGR